jgi:hypothetical protein
MPLVSPDVTGRVGRPSGSWELTYTAETVGRAISGPAVADATSGDGLPPMPVDIGFVIPGITQGTGVSLFAAKAASQQLGGRPRLLFRGPPVVRPSLA